MLNFMFLSSFYVSNRCGSALLNRIINYKISISRSRPFFSNNFSVNRITFDLYKLFFAFVSKSKIKFPGASRAGFAFDLFFMVWLRQILKRELNATVPVYCFNDTHFFFSFFFICRNSIKNCFYRKATGRFCFSNFFFSICRNGNVVPALNFLDYKVFCRFDTFWCSHLSRQLPGRGILLWNEVKF